MGMMFAYIGNLGISSACVILGYFWIDYSGVGDPLFSCFVIYFK